MIATLIIDHNHARVPVMENDIIEFGTEQFKVVRVWGSDYASHNTNEDQLKYDVDLEAIPYNRSTLVTEPSELHFVF